MNNDKSKPYWIAKANDRGNHIHDVNGVEEDQYMDYEYDDATFAKNAADRRNLVNGQA
jgi:hypothetical protein